MNESNDAQWPLVILIFVALSVLVLTLYRYPGPVIFTENNSTALFESMSAPAELPEFFSYRVDDYQKVIWRNNESRPICES
jgi:hypothetical protein